MGRRSGSVELAGVPLGWGVGGDDMLKGRGGTLVFSLRRKRKKETLQFHEDSSRRAVSGSR